MSGNTVNKNPKEYQFFISLWLEGKEPWNHWVEENPEAKVDFIGVDFSKYRDRCKGNVISFEGFKFPDGEVNFLAASFGVGCVLFKHTEFGKGDLIFRSASFSDGVIDFSNSTIKDGDINFSFSEFKNSRVLFTGAKFENGDFKFIPHIFENSYLDLDFFKSKTGNNTINLKEAKNINRLQFTETDFGKGDLFVYINGSKSIEKVDFSCIIVDGRADFTIKKTNRLLSSISFKGSRFSNSFYLSGSFCCAVDLTGTQTSNHIDLSSIECSLRRIRLLPFIWKSEDKYDAARFCRLKEIAENNKHHEAALRFHADEMRAKRWHELGLWTSLLDMMFSGFSNYGQSVARPAIWLFMTWAGLFCAYTLPSDEKNWWMHNVAAKGGSAVEFILINSLPFVANAKQIRDKSMGELFGTTPPDWLNILTIGQGIISFALLFLIGLGLRNRFRI